MKNINHEISALHAECERLKLENRLLRNLLKKHNISIEKINNSTLEQNQSNNYHQHPKVKERIRLFRSLLKVERMFMLFVGNQRMESPVMRLPVTMNGIQISVKSLGSNVLNVPIEN